MPINNTLHISRFKSIKELTLPCKRVNVFIGEPNTGKSNILEALGMFSFLAYSSSGRRAARQMAHEFVRFERTSNIFYDEDLDHIIEIQYDTVSAAIGFNKDTLEGEYEKNGKLIGEIAGDYDLFYRVGRLSSSDASQFKYYRFAVRENFPEKQSRFLLPPTGDNLLSLLRGNREILRIISQPFQARGLRLGLRPQEETLEIVKEVEAVIISYPYSLVSDTLQRITFYMAAILSNKDSVLIFEEPESHAFPYYTKQLAEAIALDENNNRYFITTHNPYLLLPLLSKAPKKDIAVNIVYYEDYQTKVKQLSDQDLAELGEIDVFSNLERYLESK
ncbi:MAG: hypothetical protein FJ316_01690 [SAR202 cluster bacterium]|nr:hypothetical protein [SAR202 cluster bacterium]